MKSLKLRLLAVLIGTVLTLGLSHVAAHASCYDYIAGGNAYGDYECRLISTCNDSCTYRCTCSSLFPGYSCKSVLQEAGFEMVSGPAC
jgi:hypothetical protein